MDDWGDAFRLVTVFSVPLAGVVGALWALIKSEAAHTRRYIDQRFVAVDQRFDAIDQRFVAVDQRFVAVDQRFDAIDQRFVAVDQRFDAIDQRFVAVDQRFDAIDQRFDAMDRRIDGLEARAVERHEALLARIVGVEANLGYLGEQMAGAKERIARIEGRLGMPTPEPHDA